MGITEILHMSYTHEFEEILYDPKEANNTIFNTLNLRHCSPK